MTRARLRGPSGEDRLNAPNPPGGTVSRETKNADASERVGAFREAGDARAGYFAILYFVALIAAAIFSSDVLAGS